MENEQRELIVSFNSLMSSVLKAWCTLSSQQSYNYQIYNFYELKNLITAEWLDGIHHRRKRSCMKGVITNIADSPILPKVVPFLFISNQGYSYYSLVQYYKPLLYIYFFYWLHSSKVDKADKTSDTEILSDVLAELLTKHLYI